MKDFKQLPNAEFEVMKAIWALEQPVTTNLIMEKLGSQKKWKAQTLISLLSRLVERGFLKTDKIRKEREYYYTIEKDDYLKFETKKFMDLYHENSFSSFVNTLYNGEKICDEDIEELLKLANEMNE